MGRFNNRKILVTGATGLIGSHLVRQLLKEDAIVIAQGRTEEKIRNVFYKELENKNFSYCVGNIANGISNVIDNVDYIFHAASPISGMEIKEKPVDTITANIDGTINCLEFLKNQGFGRLIVFSSATVYGNQFTEDITVTEDQTDMADALHTSNTPYSESKRMIEVLARSYVTQYSVDSVIVRIGYVYGYSNPRPNTAFYEFVGKAIDGENIVLNGSGMGRRDNIHVNDVVKGLMLVAEKGESGEAYNISSNGEKGNFKAIDEIADIIAVVTNEVQENDKVKAIIPSFNGNRKPGMRLDNSKLHALGWQLEESLESGIKETIRKYMN